MDLDHLETFLAIYRHQNLSRASEELHLSQPAVSSHLKALETHLGRPLFVRKARGVVATPLADSIAKDITEPLQALAATVSAYASGADRLDATIYVGGPSDALSAKVIPAIVPLINQGLIVHAVVGQTKELLERLSQGDLDLVVATTPSRKRGVRVSPLFTETLALVAGTEWASRLESPTVESLREAPMVAYAENLQLIRRYWRSVYEAAPPTKPKLVLDDLRGIIAAVIAGAGWTVVPTYLAAPELAAGSLRVLHQPAVPPSNTLFLATPSGRNNGAIPAIVDRLRMEARQW